jgi:hypothetical protein
MLLIGILLAACGGDGSNGIGPGNQLQVTNAADDFPLQVTNLNNSGGTATLTIRGPTTPW